MGFVALGGYITTQNLTFKIIMEDLGTEEYEFLGFEDGFNAFHSGNTHALTIDSFVNGDGRIMTGFTSGASRYSLRDKKTKEPIEARVLSAVNFIRAAKLDYIVGSGGDEHGAELNLLSDVLRASGIECKVLVANKTMDGDIGGEDGKIMEGLVAPFTDTSNGYEAATALISNSMLMAGPDAWTSNGPLIVTHFSEKSNFVAYGAGYYGHADLVFPGELSADHPGWSIRTIEDRIRAAQAENLRRYGRKIAVAVFPEGTKVEGIHHVSDRIEEAHGKRKIYPELLAVGLKEALSERKLDVHTMTFTYELRTFTQPDFPYSLESDYRLARESGHKLADAIRRGESGMETTIKIRDGKVEVGLAPIHLVTLKRLTSYSQYPWFNPDTFTVRAEFGRYYDPLFGGGRVERERFFPRKPQVVNVYGAPH